MKRNNRKKWFDFILESKGYTIESMAFKMGIKRDSLYRKIIGVNGFNESDIKIMIDSLDITFEKLFIN